MLVTLTIYQIPKTAYFLLAYEWFDNVNFLYTQPTHTMCSYVSKNVKKVFFSSCSDDLRICSI